MCVGTIQNHANVCMTNETYSKRRMKTMNTITRQEHLEWCKQRALEYVDAGDLQGAFASFASDTSKHPETADVKQTVLNLGAMSLFGGLLDTPQKMREHILGYN